jgi:lysophospholipase L1-like esterase
MTRTLACSFFLGLAIHSAAQQPVFDPQDGDTVVFAGDSITHQCLYTQYIENFFFTRFPERAIHFHNAGVRGDAAADVLARFDDDIAVHEPRYVTLLLGMNDGGYEGVGQDRFERYKSGVGALLDRIEAIGAQAILLTPTMFDHQVVEQRQGDATWRFDGKSFSPDYNAVMAFYGAWLREEGRRRNVPVVDLWSALNRHTREQRLQDPEFTMVQDAIHPGPAGQMVMAFEFIDQLVSPEHRRVQQLTVMQRGKRWLGNGGKTTEVRDLVVNEDQSSVRFSYLSSALPWVVPEEASLVEQVWELPDGRSRVGFSLTKAGHKRSGDVLKIVGLAPGNYSVVLDGESLGRHWSNVPLGTKIEIQENPASPQFQQALAVAKLNRERNDQVIRPLRDVWQRIKGLRRKKGIDFDAEYEALRPELDALIQKGRDYESRIRELAQPKLRTCEVKRAD